MSSCPDDDGYGYPEEHDGYGYDGYGYPDDDGYDEEYNCNTDSDSECSSLIQKFNSAYGDNYFYTIEEEEDKEGGEEEEKINPQEDMAEEDLNTDPRHQDDRIIIGGYGETWKEWALDSIITIRDMIEDYNKIEGRFFISIAGYYGKNGESGIGVLIRNRQGVPIAAFSSYDDADTMRVSPLYQELRAVEKGIDMAIELYIKYPHMICTSAEASYAITSCDREGPCGGGCEDKADMVYNLSLKIIDKLQNRRDEYQKGETPRFYFSNFAGGKLYNTPARYLARLETEGEMGPDELRKHPDLMDVIMKDANGLSGVGLFHEGYP